MKKFKKIIVMLISLLVLPNIVNAASGTITVSGPSQAVVGNRVTVTVTLKGNDIGSWNMQLNYDKSHLQILSSTAEAGGTVMANSATSGIKSKSYTFTFKTLKTGSTKISVNSYEAYAFSNFAEISLRSNSKSIKVITQAELEASYSKNNDLKNLTVDGFKISPDFNKDTLDYVVNVPEGTTSVNVKAIASDSKSSVSGSGNIEVSEGSNNVSIVVRAENGSEKTYNLVVNVIDQNPINVKVDNTNYTVIKLRSNYTCPDLFTESEVTIDSFQIPACVNEKINYTLVGLKKEDGTVENYVFNNNTYTKYIETIGTSLKIILLDYNNDLDGLEKTKETIDDIEHDVFKYSSNSKNYVVYGMNVETGDKDFYVYDTVNKTFSLYDTTELDDVKDMNKTYLYVVIAFGVALVLSFICIISLNNSKKKLKNIILNNEKNVKKESKKKKDDNEIEEIKEDLIEDEEENILGEKKKNKKKKNKKNDESDENLF